MLALLLAFGKKYLFEILLGVALLAATGYAVYTMQNWCNHACREARIERDEAKAELKKCQEASEKEMAFYLNERDGWQKQVDKQKADVVQAKAVKAKIVDDNRRKFDDIFVERKKNEAKSKERVVAQIRPDAVVVAPVALVREYNEAVAVSSGTAAPVRGSQSGFPEDPTDFTGEVATFDAVAVAEAVIENVHKYNELALRCDTLVDIVKELEAKYGTTDDGGPVQSPEADGRNVPDGVTRAEVF